MPYIVELFLNKVDHNDKFKRRLLHARVLDDVVLVTWGSLQVKAHALGRWDRCSAPSAMTLYTNSHERNKEKINVKVFVGHTYHTKSKKQMACN